MVDKVPEKNEIFNTTEHEIEHKVMQAEAEVIEEVSLMVFSCHIPQEDAMGA